MAAVGRLKDGAERDLYHRYAERLDQLGRSLVLGPLQLVELTESRAATTDMRKSDEAQRLLRAAARADVVIAIDEGGRGMTSAGFAELLRVHKDEGRKAIAFLVGGPDGHGEAALTAAQVRMSLGPMTLTHGIARIVLAEQIYRAATIIAGHPYHRS